MIQTEFPSRKDANQLLFKHHHHHQPHHYPKAMCDSAVFDRISDICSRCDDVKALEALGEEVGVEAVLNARGAMTWFSKNDTCLQLASHHDRCSLARQLIAWFVSYNIINHFNYDMIR